MPVHGAERLERPQIACLARKPCSDIDRAPQRLRPFNWADQWTRGDPRPERQVALAHTHVAQSAPCRLRGGAVLKRCCGHGHLAVAWGRVPHSGCLARLGAGTCGSSLIVRRVCRQPARTAVTLHSQHGGYRALPVAAEHRKRSTAWPVPTRAVSVPQCLSPALAGCSAQADRKHALAACAGPVEPGWQFPGGPIACQRRRRCRLLHRRRLRHQ